MLVEMAVAMRHQLVRLLRRRVHAQRVIDVVVDSERHLRVRAVDGRRRRIHEVLDRVVAAALEDVRETDDVRVDVRVRIHERVANAGLGGEVHDPVEPFAREQCGHPIAVGHIDLLEAKPFVWTQPNEARFLERYIVVVAHRIEADDRVAALEEARGGVVADEPGGAGDENLGHREAGVFLGTIAIRSKIPSRDSLGRSGPSGRSASAISHQQLLAAR